MSVAKNKRTIAISSLKGGAGKTALSVFLALALVERGYRVLAVDLDPNNNLTDFFLRDADVDAIERRNINQLLSGAVLSDDCIYESVHGVAVVPCTVELHRAARLLADNPASVLRFVGFIESLESDVVLLDTPPHPGFELSLALSAADTVLSPVALNRWTVQAWEALQTEVSAVIERTGCGPAIIKAIPFMVTEREERILRISACADGLSTLSIPRLSAVRSAAERGVALGKRTRARELFLQLSAEVMA